MTWHDGEPTDDAFRLFRASLEPLELSGKLRGVLLQYHPRFKKTPDAKAELERAPERLAPLVPLIEFRHRSWMEEDERADTLAFLEAHGLAYVSVDSPRTRASNVMPRVAAATHRSRTSASTGATHRRGTSAAARARRPLRLALLARGARGVGRPVQRLAEEADEVYALFNNNRDDFAPRSAARFRGLLDESGVPATGGIEPAAARADAVLSGGYSRAACASSPSSTTRHGRAAAACSRPSPSSAGDQLERWVHRGRRRAAGRPGAYDAIMVFGGAMHPDQDAEHPWLPGEAAFIGAALDARCPAARCLPRLAADRPRRRRPIGPAARPRSAGTRSS